jgi:putative two-component system response regulator
MTLTTTKKKLILVCDDDLEILGMMTQALQLNPKYYVVSLKNGNEVLDYLKNQKPLPDLMILDLWLPDIDSDEIIPMVREDAAIKDIPIILISAIINVEIIAKEVGAEDCLSKPFLLEELEYKVENLLN